MTILSLAIGLGAWLVAEGGWRATMSTRMDNQAGAVERLAGSLTERLAKLETGQVAATQAVLVARAEARTDADRILGEVRSLDREVVTQRTRLDAHEKAQEAAEDLQNRRLEALRDLVLRTPPGRRQTAGNTLELPDGILVPVQLPPAP
ncbi:hypothetical protein [Roseomonas indoligenes]|uniref:Uncharacterized protein n=1 Tax=Roseomonas indoligenes TaxID=2820811 RepID=A0A940MXM7_9PROT|nr:hypothetical protein [Pararoseomonas indoligenes]MBP0492885.1 hypothetical protein [Pararoseomonas indoligenes]